MPYMPTATLLQAGTSCAFEDIYNVKCDFGAVGNGTTDDTAALVNAIAAAHAAGNGIVYMPVGTYKFTTGLVVPQGVTLRGSGPLGSGQGSSLKWMGTDDAFTYPITTANTTATADFSWGCLENFRLQASGFTSTPAAIFWRNAQNASHLRNLFITGFPNVGVYADHSNPPGNDTFPGYVTCERVWVHGGTNQFRIRAGWSSLVFIACGADGDLTTIANWIVDPPLVGARGKYGNFTFLGCKSEDAGVTPGGAGDCTGFLFNVDVAASLIGCTMQQQTTCNGPFVNYAVAPTSANDVAGSIPVEIVNCTTQGISNFVTAALVTPAIAIGIGTFAGGEAFRGSWSGNVLAPAVWQGTHPAIQGTTASLTSPAATSVPISLTPAFGQTGNMVSVATSKASDTFDRVDSAITLGTSSGGLVWTAQRGTWGISTNKGYLVTTTDDACAVLDPGVADGVLTCDVTLDPVQAFPGICFRNTDVNNSLYVRLKGTTNELIFAYMLAGVQTTIHSYGYTWILGATYSFKIVLAGTSVSFYINGTLLGTDVLAGAAAANFTTPTKIGFRQNGNISNPAYDHGASRYNNLSFTAQTTYVKPDGGIVASTFAPVIVPNVTGSRGGNAALASLLTSLATIGLITDGSS